MQIPHPQQNSSYICFTEIFLADIAILKPRRNERERERERERSCCCCCWRETRELRSWACWWCSNTSNVVRAMILLCTFVGRTNKGSKLVQLLIRAWFETLSCCCIHVLLQVIERPIFTCLWCWWRAWWGWHPVLRESIISVCGAARAWQAQALQPWLHGCSLSLLSGST